MEQFLTERNDKISIQLAALRAEIEALKAMRVPANSEDPEAQRDISTATSRSAPDSIAALSSDSLQEVENAIRELSDAVEDQIAERPIVSVGAAFFLGILFGRLSRHP